MISTPKPSNLTMSISSVFDDPLFSSIITIYILILLYFPSPCIGIVLSPVLISTSVILLSLLRLGAIQKNNRSKTGRRITDPVPGENTDAGAGDNETRKRGPFGMMGPWEDRDPGVGAPLEVIHEGPENDEVSDSKRCGFMLLSEVYPETDSDSDSDVSSEDFPATGSVGFRWDGDGEDRDGMIEIELDRKAAAVEVAEGFSCDIEEEDNLIEIDLHLSEAR